MNNYNNFDNRSNNGGSSFRRGPGGRGSDRPPLHDAVCDECGNDCRVPFRPSGDKPVFCSDCFERKSGRGGGRSAQRGSFKPRFGGRDSGRPMGSPNFSQLTKNIEILNKKLDAIIVLLGSGGGKKAADVGKKKSKGKKKEGIAEVVASLKEREVGSDKNENKNKTKKISSFEPKAEKKKASSSKRKSSKRISKKSSS